MPLQQYVADNVLLWLLGTPMPQPPVALFMGLHSGATPETPNEVSGQLGGRVRLQASTFSPPQAAVGVPGREVVNTLAVTFGSATTPLSVRSFAVYDAQTGGTLLLTGDVIPDVNLRAGDPAIFSVGDLILRIGQGV